MDRTDSTVEVLGTLPPSYSYSEEQQLAVRLLRQRLPADARVSLIQRGDRSPAEVLAGALAARLADPAPLPTYLLLIEEAWVFLGNECVSNLVRLLDTQSHLDCALPVDQRGGRRTPPPRYHTLRAFDAFTHALQTRKPQWQAYDGRQPSLFLVRASALRDLALDDVFGLPALLGKRAAIALDAYAHLPIDYYGEGREDILALVPEGVTSLLDIGCARGNFGALVKAHRACRVVGIEPNPVVGEAARQHLDEVFIGDALHVDPGERFQCVTCLDVVEHVDQSHRLLDRICQDFLQPGGTLIVSVPNVGHWSIVADLVAGYWDYVPIGLLCVGHLRFFTLASLRALFEEHGLEILHVGRVSDPVPRSLRRLLEKWAKAGMELDMDNLAVMNYHILARLPGGGSTGDT